MEETSSSQKPTYTHSAETNENNNQNAKGEYASLYEELLDKCNPNRFLKPYNKDLFNLANEIYEELQKRGVQDDKSFTDLRDKAISELGIDISTKRLYDYLLNYCHPDIYISIKPYDKDRVQKAGVLYEKIINAKNDIYKLEEIEKEAEAFILQRKRELTLIKIEQDTREKREDKIQSIINGITVLAIIAYIIISLYSMYQQWHYHFEEDARAAASILLPIGGLLGYLFSYKRKIKAILSILLGAILGPIGWTIILLCNKKNHN